MERYKYFENLKSLDDFAKDLIIREIGEGKEGTAYLIKNNLVLKMLDGYCEPYILDSKKDSIIMQQDCDVSSFLFPKQLLISYERVQGYIMDYFPNNILLYADPYNGNINDIDFDILLRAREQMIKDTIKLTDNKIAIGDLTFNLLFDNSRFGAIDTLDYKKDTNVTLEDNIKKIDEAILTELYYHDVKFIPNYDKSIEYNLKRTKK